MRLLPVEAADLGALRAALAAALDGAGPPVLPLPPPGPQREAVLAAARPEEPLEDDDVAVVVATSGSTGEAKGVLLSRTALLASASATHARLGGPGWWLLALPCHHVAGLQVLVRSLLAGTDPLVLPPGAAPDAFAAATSDGPPEARTYTSLVPTQLRRVIDSGRGALEALASYDAVLVGGAAAPDALVEEAAAAGVSVVLTYGMSETSGGCVYDGWPLDGVEVEVRDGRVVVAGPVLFSGYRGRRDLTAQALVDGRLLTQDRGRWRPDGRLEVLGRLDDVVVSGGENVALPAVEAALLRLPGVAEAAALGLPDREWGTAVVAVVVPHGPAPSLADVRAGVADQLGRAAAPRSLHVLDALPLAGPGKVDRSALRRLVVPAAADHPQP